MVWRNFKNHEITIPSYCISRSVHSEMIDYTSVNDPLCFISGNFYSGKTFFLLEIARLHFDKKVYIFPSGTKISDVQLETMVLSQWCLCAFFSNKSVINNAIRFSQVRCTSRRCGNNVSVKTMPLKSIGLFYSKNTLRILPYLPRDCVSACANLMSGI